MRKVYITSVCLIALFYLRAQEETDTIRLTLNDAIVLAQTQSVDAAVALNELKSAYWEYRTYRADQLPEVKFIGGGYLLIINPIRNIKTRTVPIRMYGIIIWD